MKFRFFFLIGSCILLLNFSGLAQTSSTDAARQIDKDAPQLKPFEGNRYRLNPGDIIEINYRYTPEFNQTVAIQPDGFVTLEIVGELKISGLTVEQARQKILENAVKRLKDPEVILLLKEFQKPYFVVSGEVVQPGKFELNQNITALQAVLLAGGFKDSAKSSQILVFRKINSETAEIKLLNLKNIRKTSDLESDFALESGDMIMVPRNMITKVERYVKFANIASIFGVFLR
ncbi:MAG TPA: polysaccharide biosynthesis/export family protein [Pyrinomonadaceae bacterium]|jgi:polysaccharide export outer membrane protein